MSTASDVASSERWLRNTNSSCIAALYRKTGIPGTQKREVGSSAESFRTRVAVSSVRNAIESLPLVLVVAVVLVIGPVDNPGIANTTVSQKLRCTLYKARIVVPITI